VYIYITINHRELINPTKINFMQTVNFKGYTIQVKNGSHCAMIYKNKQLIKCIAGNILSDNKHNAIDKAKNFINQLQ
jgi:archaellum component FlaG (FlaF/FlaG flagellin family)